jgi:hypothetical protein
VQISVVFGVKIGINSQIKREKKYKMREMIGNLRKFLYVLAITAKTV